MLPDLRIVVAAVISTFVLTVGAGFYASSRMMHEPKKRTDSLAALEETPVNRIALSWPEPMRQSAPLALDFAVTARALRNPVRDVSSEPAAAEPQPVRTTATDLAVPAPAETPAQATPAKIEAEPALVISERPEPAPDPDPDIRVAVQYPPILELPPELQAPPVPVAQTPAAAPVIADTPSTTGSVAEPPKDIAADDADTVQPPGKPANPEIASRPEPAEADTADDDQVLEQVPTPKPAPKARTKTAPKKAAPAKAAKRPAKAVRRPVRRTVPNLTSTFPFNFFGTTLPN